MCMSGYSCSVPNLGYTRPIDLCFPALNPSIAGKEHYEEQQMLALGLSAILNSRANAPQKEIKLPDCAASTFTWQLPSFAF